MSNLAIIPARGGSKRILGKNIKHFLGKPIIAYTIETAINSQLFDEVMVSTDDEEIAIIAEQLGAKVPFFRSPESSDDFATTVDVLIEVINRYLELNKVFDHACCLYPTAPFITETLLKTGFNLLKSHSYSTVFPVVAFDYPIQRSLQLSEYGKVEMVWPEFLLSRSQDLPKRYHDTGMFYWFSPQEILNDKKLFGENSGALIISELACHDIDNPDDWEMAELKFRRLNSHLK